MKLACRRKGLLLSSWASWARNVAGMFWADGDDFIHDGERDELYPTSNQILVRAPIWYPQLGIDWSANLCYDRLRPNYSNSSGGSYYGDCEPYGERVAV